MKKVAILLLCTLGATAALTSCKEKKTQAAPCEVAKMQHERLRDQDYIGYIDDIYFEEFMPPVEIDAKREEHVKILKENVQPKIQEKGGIKQVEIKTREMAPNRKTANVVLTNTYNNGDKEDVFYSMILDNETNEWKVRMNEHKEVWKTRTEDGHHESFKLKDYERKDVAKHRMDDERDFLKIKDGENKDVVKIKVDGEKEVTKVIERKDETVVKTKVDGEKEVKRIPKEGNK